MGRWARKPVNHTSWVAVVTPTDRPKSVRNRCLIELFCGVVCVVTLPFWHFCWCRGFCHRTESDLFLFLLSQKGWYNKPTNLQFKSILTQNILIISERYESIEVDRRTWLNMPSGTHWSTSSDTSRLTNLIYTILKTNKNSIVKFVSNILVLKN